MAKSKKTASKQTTTKSDDSKVEARPIGQGKDPLAEGATLHNETNTEAETHYKADNSELKAEEKASKIRGQNANERAEEHNAQAVNTPSDVPNSDATDQDAVAEGRTEEPINRGTDEVDDTPEEVEVPERSEEQEEADSEDRQDAMAKAIEQEK